MYRLKYAAVANFKLNYQNKLGSANDKDSLFTRISNGLNQAFLNVKKSNLTKTEKTLYQQYIMVIKNNLFDILNISFDKMKGVVDKNILQNDSLYFLSNPGIDFSKKLFCRIFDPETGAPVQYKSGKKKDYVKRKNENFMK